MINALKLVLCMYFITHYFPFHVFIWKDIRELLGHHVKVHQLIIQCLGE